MLSRVSGCFIAILMVFAQGFEFHLWFEPGMPTGVENMCTKPSASNWAHTNGSIIKSQGRKLQRVRICEKIHEQEMIITVCTSSVLLSGLQNSPVFWPHLIAIGLCTEKVAAPVP